MSFQGPQSSYLIRSMFLKNRGLYSFVESVRHWGSYGLKQGNPLQNYKITHNYLIFLFYYHFLTKFIVISSSIELIFNSFNDFSVSIGELIWGKVSDIESAMAWYKVIPCTILKITHTYLIIIFYYHFLVHFLIISRSIYLIFDSLNVFLG